MKNKIIIIISMLVISIFIPLLIYKQSLKKLDSQNRVIVTLNKCIDGDTIWLKENGKIKKYRLLGIDTPEVNEEYGKDATTFTCDILKTSKKIEIEYDKYGNINDNYNRELVWIYVDNELLQNKILINGLGRVRYIYATYDNLDSLYSNEKYAINKKIGIWKNYKEENYNNYYTISFDYEYKTETIKVKKNSVINKIENANKKGCKFIGWKNGNYLFDLSTKITKDYKLKASFKC